MKSKICGIIETLVKEPKFPIVFDPLFNEYKLSGKFGEFVFSYCPHCGARLPKSKREDFFTKPSKADVADFRRRTRHVKSFEEALAALGKPDRQYRPVKANPTPKSILKEALYYKQWKTLEASFVKKGDGSLQISYSDKYIGPGKRIA